MAVASCPILEDTTWLLSNAFFNKIYPDSQIVIHKCDSQMTHKLL